MDGTRNITASLKPKNNPSSRSTCAPPSKMLKLFLQLARFIGLCFLEFPGYHTDEVLSEGPHSEWTALFWTIKAPTQSNQTKKARNPHKKNLFY